MKPVFQTIFTVPGGNCMAACVASILELSLDDVPNPQGEDGQWYLDWQAFLKPRNLSILCFPTGGEWTPQGYSILCGRSPRGDWNHAVVCYNGIVAHDPHPDGTSVVSQVDWTVFTVLDPAKGIPVLKAWADAKRGDIIGYITKGGKGKPAPYVAWDDEEG